jgi:hypothetical protein
LRPSGAAGKPEPSEAAPSVRRIDLSRFATGVWAECGPVFVDHGCTSPAAIPSSLQPSSCRERFGSEPIDPMHDLGEQGSGHRYLGQLEHHIAAVAHDASAPIFTRFSRGRE